MFTIPSKIAAAAEPRQRYSRKKENPMTSRNLKRFTASCVTAALVLAGMLVLGSETAEAQSERGLEGTWRAQLTVSDCQNPSVVLRTFPAKFSYAKGGTLTVTTAGQLPSLSTAGLGIWNHEYGRTYSAVSEAFIFSSAGVWTSTQRLMRVIVVSKDAKRYTDTVALEILDTNGNVIVTGCGTSVANRME
jgi:hypothetical protein